MIYTSKKDKPGRKAPAANKKRTNDFVVVEMFNTTTVAVLDKVDNTIYINTTEAEKWIKENAKTDTHIRRLYEFIQATPEWIKMEV